MNDLIKIQQAFQEQLLGKSSNLSHQIVATKKPDVHERIKIYTDSYSARLIEALGNNYSQLSQYLGPKAFTQLAKAYLALYPSNFRTIGYFGDKLPVFLQEQYPKSPVLAELARFEWAIGNAADAIDSQSQTIDDLKKIAPDLWADMKFELHPSVQLHNFTYNIITLWKGLLHNQIKKACKLRYPQSVIFGRHNLEAYYRPVSKIEAEAICCILNGNSFATICDQICLHVEENNAATKATTLLIQWLNTGIISKISMVS